MSLNPRTDVVAQQYRKWQYPEPIQNLETWLGSNWQWFDPSHSHRLLWPDRPYQPDLDILIAGCGTNQAAVFAYTNRAAKVVAIDVSQPSLDHTKFLKDKYSLKNLELHLLPIEEIPTLNQTFDLIVSTGVLHHLADPAIGMQALASSLRPEGVVAIMLYARYGRAGVEVMQGVFRDMGLEQDESSLQIIKAALNALPANHPLRPYMAIAPDLQFDAGMVDTFLHGRDCSYTVEGCLELVKSAGLVFQDWLLKTSYTPSSLTEPNNEFLTAVRQLPIEKVWSVMERIKTVNACHFFLATHADRKPESYRIDFSSPEAPDYIPLWRLRCGMSGEEAVRPGWRVRLDETQLAFAVEVNGELSIREIASRLSKRSAADEASQAEWESLGVKVFTDLWQSDFVAMDLDRVSHS